MPTSQCVHSALNATDRCALCVLQVPFIEASIHWVGLIGTFLVTSALGVLFACLQLVPTQAAQLAGAVAFAAFRAFLFSILAAFNGATFGPTSMGRIMGLCMFVSSLVNLCQARPPARGSRPTRVCNEL